MGWGWGWGGYGWYTAYFWGVNTRCWGPAYVAEKKNQGTYPTGRHLFSLFWPSDSFGQFREKSVLAGCRKRPSSYGGLVFGFSSLDKVWSKVGARLRWGWKSPKFSPNGKDSRLTQIKFYFLFANSSIKFSVSIKTCPLIGRKEKHSQIFLVLFVYRSDWITDTFRLSHQKEKRTTIYWYFFVIVTALSKFWQILSVRHWNIVCAVSPKEKHKDCSIIYT